MPGYIRVSFSVPAAILERAAARVEAACRQLQAQRRGLRNLLRPTHI
jgi:hypothetical protein